MTCKELWKQLEAIIVNGGGDAEVMFDTEARTFDYHMAVVGGADYEQLPKPHVCLVETPPKE
jgi:hypothetical protein